MKHSEKKPEVEKAVETSWKKPLRLHEDTVEEMWAATQSDVGIASVQFLTGDFSY